MAETTYINPKMKYNPGVHKYEPELEPFKKVPKPEGAGDQIGDGKDSSEKKGFKITDIT